MNDEAAKFYDNESSTYSLKRYPTKITGYSHYLFGVRKKIFLNFIKNRFKESFGTINLLDIGCADGIGLRAVESIFPKKFKFTGIDVSPKMIEVARMKNKNLNAIFYLREELPPEERFDVILELGVHPYNLDSELSYVNQRLKPGGLFFYSLASSDSVYAHVKLKEALYTKDYKKYEEYEAILSNYFFIENSKAYGLFVPKLWAFPAVARVVQPVFDIIFRHIFPNFLHEKIYLLRSKAK